MVVNAFKSQHPRRQRQMEPGLSSEFQDTRGTKWTTLTENQKNNNKNTLNLILLLFLFIFCNVLTIKNLSQKSHICKDSAWIIGYRNPRKQDINSLEGK